MPPLTNEERYILSVTLASSFLQLHKTPWLGDLWSKNDVFFKTASRQGQHHVNVRYPYVMKNYQQTTNPTATIWRSKTPSTHGSSVNLLTLAKILLEIRLDDSIENHRQPEDLGPNALVNEATDLLALKRWIKRGGEPVVCLQGRGHFLHEGICKP